MCGAWSETHIVGFIIWRLIFQFAVKEIDLCRCDEEGREQALREASLLSRLKHESILKYIDSCVNDDCLYIITEYCGGGDLEEYWQLCARLEYTLPESLVSEWIFEIGGALKVVKLSQF